MKRGILVGLLVVVAAVSVAYAQAPKQLKVEVGPNEQIWITASDVTYGEILRALQEKLDCAIEIPSTADEQKLSYMKVENKQPQDAFAELFTGSKFGYALLGGNGSPITKVIVTVSKEKESPAGPGLIPPATDAAAPGTSLPSASASDESVPPPVPPAQLSLSDAANAVGVPSGASPATVGRQTTFSMADAASVMGVPPGVSPSEVGQAQIFPLSEAASVIGVPSGVSSDSVGKTITLPLANGAGQRP